MASQDWSKLTVPLLKAELTNRGLPITGLKKDLVERLTEADTAAGEGGASETEAQEEAAKAETVAVGNGGEEETNAGLELDQDKSENPSAVGLKEGESAGEGVAVTVEPARTSAGDVQGASTMEAIVESKKRPRDDSDDGIAEHVEEKRASLDSESTSLVSGPPLVEEKEAAAEMEVREEEPALPPPPPVLPSAQSSDPQKTTTSSLPEPSNPPPLPVQTETATSISPSLDTQPPPPPPQEDSPTQDPSSPPLSSSLYISNLVRPFTVPQLKEMLEEYGTVSTFWIDAIKSHCYATYSAQSDAVTAFATLSTISWPPQTGKALKVLYVPTSRVEGLIKEEEFVSKSTHRGAPRVRMDLNARWHDGRKTWVYELEGGRRESTFGVGIQKEEKLAPVAVRPPPVGPRNSHQPPLPPHQGRGGGEVDSRGPRFAPPRQGPSDSELRELELKLKLERRPIGGPEKYFKKTKTEPAIFYQENSRPRRR